MAWWMIVWIVLGSAAIGGFAGVAYTRLVIGMRVALRDQAISMAIELVGSDASRPAWEHKPLHFVLRRREFLALTRDIAAISNA